MLEIEQRLIQYVANPSLLVHAFNRRGAKVSVYGLALTKSTPFWMFFFKSAITSATFHPGQFEG